MDLTNPDYPCNCGSERNSVSAQTSTICPTCSGSDRRRTLSPLRTSTHCSMTSSTADTIIGEELCLRSDLHRTIRLGVSYVGVSSEKNSVSAQTSARMIPEDRRVLYALSEKNSASAQTSTTTRAVIFDGGIPPEKNSVSAQTSTAAIKLSKKANACNNAFERVFFSTLSLP